MQPDVLDPSNPVACEERAPWFDQLVRDWEDKSTSLDVVQALHRFDLARAAQPPVVNVTVAGMPGFFSHVTGTEEVAYQTGAPGTDDLPVVVVQEGPGT